MRGGEGGPRCICTWTPEGWSKGKQVGAGIGGRSGESGAGMLSCSAAPMRADTRLEGTRCICTWTPASVR
jgi:hypothetical protein